jgi:hypothetical protein
VDSSLVVPAPGGGASLVAAAPTVAARAIGATAEGAAQAARSSPNRQLCGDAIGACLENAEAPKRGQRRAEALADGGRIHVHGHSPVGIIHAAREEINYFEGNSPAGWCPGNGGGRGS